MYLSFNGLAAFGDNRIVSVKTVLISLLAVAGFSLAGCGDDDCESCESCDSGDCPSCTDDECTDCKCDEKCTDCNCDTGKCEECTGCECDTGCKCDTDSETDVPDSGPSDTETDVPDSGPFDTETDTSDTDTQTDVPDDTDSDTAEEKAKYVFYLIGDGMGLAQINAAEYYLASLVTTGGTGPNNEGSVNPPVFLNMSTLAAHGFSTTYSNNAYITDSAAAGTALACGYKTDSGVLSMSPDLSTSYESIAAQAKNAGMRVGIISSVSIDHATPAVFYANEVSRNNYYNIGMSLTNSGFDYFGGGGFRTNKYNSENGDGTWDDIANNAATKGYTIVESRTDFEALTETSGKVIAVNPVRDSSNAMPYDMIRDTSDNNNDISLNEFVEKGIELLDNENGFFLMVESGKIDWAGHANDAAANIKDTLHFDEVVGTALDFYEEHPDETLIVITADHECGGMTLGFAGTSYDTMYELIDNQLLSFDAFDAVLDTLDPQPSALSDLNALIETNFGFDMNDDGTGLALSAYERSTLEDAFKDWQSYGSSGMSADELYLTYGGYSPLSVTLTHILNQQAGIAWTSYSHTGVQVPVFAQGAGEELFNGYYDNTDIYYYIHAAMGLE